MGFKTDGLFDRHKCLDCGQMLTSRRSAGNHFAKSHNQTSILTYVLKHYLDNLAPECMCGCGKPVTWHKSGYKFNDYVTGHNASGFKVKQPTFSEEQVTRRNAAIKKTYREKKDEISKKISEKVKSSFARPEWKEAHSKIMKERWANDSYREKVSKSQKESWDADHDKRCARIFTPEFGKKISEANMLRNATKDSAQERAFADHLQSVFGEIKRSLWIVLGDGLRKCVDVYIPSEDVYVEFDGIYWHGLDRTSEYSFGVLQNMLRDMLKNQSFAASDKRFLRVASNIDISLVKDMNSLISSAYHVSGFGSSDIDGTCRFHDEDIILSRDWLIAANEGFVENTGREWTKNNVLPLIVDLVRSHCDIYGWFYPEHDLNLYDAFSSVYEASTRLMTNSTITSSSHAGVAFLKSLFQSFWHAGNGPAELTQSDALERVIAYRMGLNGTKMTYNTSGVNIDTTETFNLTLKEIRKGFVVGRHTVSFFKPAVAAAIYRRMLGDASSPRVWDPSGGFGGRMLGFYSAYPNGSYTCNEPAAMTSCDLMHLAEMIDGDILIDSTPAEESAWDGIPFDLVFTSPPYFDKESYFDEPTQCNVKFTNESLWEKGFLAPVIRLASERLKIGGALVMNVDEQRKEAVLRCAVGAGLKTSEDENMELTTVPDHFARKRGFSGKKEPVLVFRKV